MANSDLIEPAFGQNEFRKPKVLVGEEVLVQSVLMILFGKPGCYPSIPELGMHIQQYRVWNRGIDDLEEIRDTLSYQCGLIRTGMVDSQITMGISTIQDNRKVLLIQIPVIKEVGRYNLIIGITDRDNEVIYNYQLVNAMLMGGS